MDANGVLGRAYDETTQGLRIQAPAAGINVIQATPAAANLVSGYLNFTSTTAATTLITVPAGKTWQGTAGASCDVAQAAATATAGVARAVFTTVGAGATPAAGTIFAVEARAGANAATGTVGSQAANSAALPMTIVAPSGNAVTVAVASTCAGTNTSVDAWASGVLTTSA